MLRKTNRFNMMAIPPRTARIFGGALSRHAENEYRFARRDANELR